MGSWFRELGRRNVIRVALAYVVAGWLVLQVADVVLDNIGAPAWVMQVMMLVLALGLPVALAFSWVYELTPDGLRRESEIDRAQSITPQTGQKLERVIVGLLVLALVMVGAQWLNRGAPDTADERVADTSDVPSAVPGELEEAGTAGAAPAKSIAVLAFNDLSPAGNQAYFADGIAEELLNVLAQVPGLKVAGRTSSFAFKDQKRDLREIGEILEVAHILEGSVRTDGNRVRVTAQLIKAEDGYHLFSRNYDRDLNDIFKVQDEIANEIAVALKATILGESSVEKVAETNPATYENYLKARQWIHTRDHELMERALTVLDEALALDPDYAPALAQKAMAMMLLSDAGSSYGDISVEDALAEIRPLVDRALELEPNSAEAHAVMGLWYSESSLESSPEALFHLRRALEINPALTNAINWLALELPRDTGYMEAVALYESALENDPLYRPAFNNLINSYMERRRIDDAVALVRRVERVAGDSPIVLLADGFVRLSRGDLATSLAPLESAWEYNTRASIPRFTYGTALMFIGEFERAAEILPGKDRLIALWLLNRTEDAEAEFAAGAEGMLDEYEIRAMGDWLLVQDREDDLIDFMEKQFRPGDAWLDELPVPVDLGGWPIATNAACALLRTGRKDDARQVLRLARQKLDIQRSLGADNAYYWLNEAEYAALTGDAETFREHLARAIDTGYVSLAGFWQPTFVDYRSDPGFVALEERTMELARAERAKAGLPELVR